MQMYKPEGYILRSGRESGEASSLMRVNLKETKNLKVHARQGQKKPGYARI